MSPDEKPAAHAAGSGHSGILRRELVLFAALLAVALVLMPPAIYYTGQALLGEYSREGEGLLHLYGQLVGDLVSGGLAAWLLFLGPWLGVMLIRLLWWPLRPRRGDPDAGRGETPET